ncbi:MAG: hypothetical protein SH850_04110 [Planctomycetaceae bacterium]|nr:hypothetical protein [Planctomycetaceae bacterium]
MNVNLELSAEIESTLRRQAAASGVDVATFVSEVVTERLAAEPQPMMRAASHEEFMAKLRRIIDRHAGFTGQMDDSRESIYAVRGE